MFYSESDHSSRYVWHGYHISRILIAAFMLMCLSASIVFFLGSPSGQSSHQSAGAEETPAQNKGLTIIAEYPFDKSSFTQGLEVLPQSSYPQSTSENPILAVGTGLKGKSRIYYTDLQGTEYASEPLDAGLFGEGLTVHDQNIWQLTWRDNRVLRRNIQTLNIENTHPIGTEGWGLCSLGDSLILSDGSSELSFRNPKNFQEEKRITVTADGVRIYKLNELECSSHGTVWANVWQKNSLYEIDPNTGHVLTIVDTTNLLPAAQRPDAGVLNGIAQKPGTDHFYITGKNWDTLYEVRFNEL